MHIPQSIQTAVELEQICLVPKHIISPGTSTPCIEITQDTLLGAYLLTRKDIRLRRDQMYNYMMFAKKYNGILPEPEGFENNIPYWSGKQLYSLILPDITISQIKTIEIIRGNITKGFLSSDSLGSDSAGLIKQIYNAYGMETCNDFLNDTQKLITRWMVDNSFTIGFGDSTVNKEQRKRIKEITNKYLEESFDLIRKAQHGVFANDLDDEYKGSNLEFQLMKILSNLSEKVKENILENIDKNNNFYQAGDKGSGAKGKTTNIQQIMGCVGQQDIWGTRIEEGFTQRTLPHFTRNDVGPDAKGFCRNSFIEGLSPSEMFFHAMGGRTGTIDTAIKTADSGYLSRKFIKAAEDLMVNYDFTVRNASNHIVQFGYGDDNFDPIKLEKVTRIELIEFDNKKMEEVYKHESFDSSYFENFMLESTVKEMMEDQNYKSLLNDEYEEILQYRQDLRYNYFKNTEAIGDINTYIPINLYRVIPSQLIKFNVQSFDLSDLTPQYVIQTYNDALKDIIKYLPEKEGNWKLFKIIFKSFLSTKKVIKEYRMSKAVYDSIILIIKEKMMGALINPGELVGIIGAQTLGEISTQLTLNSVTYETEIIVRDSNKNIRKYQIGEFIEREIRKSQKIDYMEDKDTTYAECLEYFEIPSCNEQGKVEWKRIEAVTRHPVINKDGSNTMLKVTTEDEREVIATKAKSFLKLIDGKIIACEGSVLKVGDYLPVSTKQIDFEETCKLDLRSVLPMNEYVYGSELEKAKSVMNEHHWWLKHANKTFTLPHGRSDSVVQLASDRVRKGRNAKSVVKDGNVYMLLSNKCEYTIPEIIDLDYNFGYLIGAYCVEGCMTKHQISIANNDSAYFAPIEELCKKWNITTKIYRHENKKGWTSQDLRIYNTLLCRILEKFCGKSSHNKFISDKIIFSNKTCLKGLLDAYIGGNGYIDIKKNCIEISSVSKSMLIDVQQILNTFDVYSVIRKYKKQETNNRGSKDIKQIYHLFIRNKQSQKLASILNMKIDYKQSNLVEILKHDFKFEYNQKSEYVPNEIDGEIIFEERNGRFIDVVFDKIKSIKEVENTTNYAYDLTVEENRTFNIYNLLCCMDTFHLAGVGAGSLVITQGIPRLRELINVSKNPKEKNMMIYLKDEFSTNKDNARKVQSRFGYTQLKDILAKTEILYDNKYGITDSKEDREFIKSYKEFAELFDIDNIDESCLSPWILRLTFDKEGLMNRKITIQEIQETIKESFHNDQEIDCIYSDDSVNDVIMRIRIKQDSKGSFLDFMKDFEKQLISLPLRGITNIKKVELTDTNILKYNFDGSIQPSKEWILRTSGSNIVDILGDDAVDSNRTITNDIIEFHEIFGIEATREMLYKELYKVYSGKCNPRHIQMLSDIMTYRGKLMQIDRHGLNKNSEIGPISKASFEEVMNIFTKAALFAEKDNMKGVSANILAGQFCKSGTNSFEILIDEDKLLEKIDIPDYNDADDTIANEKDIDKVFSSVYESYEPTEDVEDKDFTFGFGIEEAKEYELGTIKTSNVIISEKELVNGNEGNKFNQVDINTTIDYGVQNLGINFEQVNIEEPAYEIPEEIKPKKIKVKKEKVEKEEKPKKIKVVKKKGVQDDNEK